MSDHENLPEGLVSPRCLACPAFNKVLLVRETAGVDADLEKVLQPIGLQVTTVIGLENALPAINPLDYEFLLWDTHLPQGRELAALRGLRRKCPQLPVIVLADDAEAETAIELMKAGANDFLAKPLEMNQLRQALERVLKGRRLLCDAFLITNSLESRGQPLRLVGQSRVMQEMYQRIGLVAERDEPVLIYGETGSGKELVARAIHRHSGRRDRAFLAINCAALPETLLESELFGYEKGTFTGATQRRLGAFEEAHGGTLFLDEIGDMSMPLQAKILRVLQQGEIHRLGRHETIAVDVRIVAATNRLLEGAVAEGKFRQDLYYRMNVVLIQVPPLRQHPEDILQLVEYFIDRYTPPEKIRPALDVQALTKLQAHNWPGNVRELENTIRRALVAAKGEAVMAKDIILTEPGSSSGSPSLCAGCSKGPLAPNTRHPDDTGTDSRRERDLEEQLAQALQQWFAHWVGSSGPQANPLIAAKMQAKLLETALKFTSGNQVKAARLLGISRSTLREHIKRNL